MKVKLQQEMPGCLSTNETDTEKNKADDESDIAEHCVTDVEDETVDKPNFGSHFSKPAVYHGLSDSDSDNFFESNNVVEEESATADEAFEEKETMDIPKFKWELLKGELQEISECSFVYDKDKEVLHIEGRDVVMTKNKIFNLCEKVKKISLQLSPEQDKVLKNTDVKTLLNAVCNVGNKKSVCDITRPTLNVYGIGDVKEKLEIMKAKILHTHSVEVPAFVPKYKIRDCENHYNSFALVTVSFDEVQSKFILAGLVEDVKNVSDDIEKMIEEYKWRTSIFTLKGKDAVFVKKYAKDQLKILLKHVIKESNKRGKISIWYKCQKVHKKKLDDDLTIFRKNILKAKVDLTELDEEELELVQMNMKRDGGLFKDFKATNKCCIFVESIQTNEENMLHKQTEEHFNDVSLDAELVKENPHDLYSNGQIKVLTFGTPCAIKILPNGDIVQEKSDLLVCCVNDSLDMQKSRVSKAFLKADRSMQDQIRKYHFSPNRVFVEKRSLSGSNCQAIAFIVLETWQQGLSDKKIISAVLEVLDTANKMGFKSVSIPPLTNKYPNDVVARATTHAIDSFVKTNPGGLNNIKTINLLAPDRQLFTEMVTATNNVTRVSGDDDSNEERKNASGATVISFVKEFYKLSMWILFKLLTLIKEGIHGGKAKSEKLPIITVVWSKQEGTVPEIDIALKLKNEIKKHWLFVDYFRPGDKFLWPPQFMNDVTETGKKLHVRTKKVEDPTSKEFVYKIKGKMEDVLKMKDELLHKVLKINRDKLLFSRDAPERGTVEFINHATSCENQFPSYWKLKWEEYANGMNQGKILMHDVNGKSFKAIEKLVLNTWDINKVGAGYDAAYIPSRSQVKVISVQRLENPALFSSYFGKRLAILRDMKLRGHVCCDVGQLYGSKGPVQTMQNLDDEMKVDLLHEINEQYMFHGTKECTVKAISEQGVDCRLSSPDAMFGLGVYTSESSTKADQYSDDRNSRLRNGANLTMFMTRVVLGEVFLCDDKHETVQSRQSTKLKRPPCLSCLKDICASDCSGTGQFYHSVMGNGKWIFREFIVYNNDQCYPEYLIKYQRVKK